MDPDATLVALIYAATNGQPDDVREFGEALALWLENGGFAPMDPAAMGAPYVWPDGTEVTVASDRLTREQWGALARLRTRHKLGTGPVTVIPGMGYVGIEASGMFIGIEPDGYTHT